MARLEIDLIGKNNSLIKAIQDSEKAFLSLSDTAKKTGALKIDISLGKTIANLQTLNKTLTDTSKLYKDLRASITAINSTSSAGITGGGTKAAIDAQKLALAQARTETERYRTEAAKLRAELNQLTLTNRKNKDTTTAAIGSYREAQQRLTAMGKAIREATNGFNLSNPAIQAQIREYRALNEQLKAFDRQMGLNYRNVGNYGSMWSGVGRQISMVAGSYLSLFAVIQGGNAILRTNAEISDSIADIQRTAELSQQEARDLFNELKKLETRTSLGELAEISVIGGQLGIAKDELVGFTEAVDMLAVVLANEIPGGAEAVTEALGKINGVFRVAETEGLTAGEAMQKTGSAILALGQAGLATGKFLVDFTQRVGGAARTVGVALPTVLAYGAVLEEAGVSAEVAGTAVSKLLGQLAVRRNEFFAIAKLADATLTIESFTDLINTDADAALRKFFAGLAGGGKTTTQFYDILGSAKINTERYRNAVLLLSQDQEKLTELTALSTEEYEKGSKAAEQFELRNTTLGASIDKLTKAFQALTTSGNMADFLQGFVDGIAEATTAIDKLINSSSWKELFTRLSGFGTTWSGSLSSSLGISNIQGDVIKSLKELEKADRADPNARIVRGFKGMTLEEQTKELGLQKESLNLLKQEYETTKGLMDFKYLQMQTDLVARLTKEYKGLNEEKEDAATGTDTVDDEEKNLEASKAAAKRLEQAIIDSNNRIALSGKEGREKEEEQIKQWYASRLALAKKGSSEYVQLENNMRAEIDTLNKEWDTKAQKQIQEFVKKRNNTIQSNALKTLEENRKLDIEEMQVSLTYQRRLWESRAQTAIRGLNAEYKVREEALNKWIESEINAGKKRVDVEKQVNAEKAKLQEELYAKIEALTAQQRELDIQTAFNGDALSVPIARINDQITELRRNFQGLTETEVAAFQQKISDLEVQRQQLQLFQGTVDNISGAFGNLYADAIFDTENAMENLGKAFENTAKSIISGLIKIGVRYLINQAIGQSSMTATAIASSATAKTIASAWSTAAALVSAASYGANVAIGGGALAALITSTKALSGFAKGGYTGNVARSDVAGVVHGQEFVINAAATRDNLPLLKAINSGMDISGMMSPYQSTRHGKINPDGNRRVEVHVVGEISGETIKLVADRAQRSYNRYF